MYINPHKIHETLWRCDCGKEFNKSSSLTSHSRFCNQYIKVDKISPYKKGDEYICECGYITTNYQSFNAHLSHCDIHHNILGFDKKLRPSEINHSMNWERKTNEEIQQIHQLSAITYKQKYKNGEIESAWKGKKLPEEMKEKIRISTIQYLETLIPNFAARYNKTACEYFDFLNIQYGWNLQHAENGGEIRCGGYFLDAYDKEKNIVVEYDEPRHYKDIENNILKDKDIDRQNFIIEKLNNIDLSKKSAKELTSKLISMKKMYHKRFLLGIFLGFLIFLWMLHDIYVYNLSHFMFAEGFPTCLFICANATVMISVLTIGMIFCTKMYKKQQRNISELIEMIKDKE